MPANAFRGTPSCIPEATSVASGGHSAGVPPALVVGTGITALGIVRTLGRAGIPRFALSASPGPVRRSRWYRAPLYKDFLHSPGDLAEYLHRCPLDGGVLIPASDEDALAVAGLPADLKARFPSSLSAASLLGDLVDKGRLLQLLTEHGVPHPATVVVDGPEHFGQVTDVEPARAFIKPRSSQAFARRFNVKAVRPTDQHDMRAKLEWLIAAEVPVVVQEYVPGPPSNHYFADGFMDAAGKVRCRFARRRLRMFPPDFGNSSALTTVAPETVSPAVEDLERLLGAIGYRGIYSAEFKQDERDGTFRLLEINARAWWYVEFAAGCGIDVVTMAYRDALGLPVFDAFTYPHGRDMVYPPYDIAAFRASRNGDGGVRAADCLRSLFRSDWAVFAADDPLPGLADLAGMAGRGVKRWLRGKRSADAAADPPRRLPPPSMSGPSGPRRVNASPTGPGNLPSDGYPKSASPSSRPRPGEARWS